MKRKLTVLSMAFLSLGAASFMASAGDTSQTPRQAQGQFSNSELAPRIQELPDKDMWGWGFNETCHGGKNEVRYNPNTRSWDCVVNDLITNSN